MRTTLFILLFSFGILSNAQSYYSDNITSRDGLPDNAIRSIFQDSRGYLWIGTDAGVSKWDGENFYTYNTLDGLAGNKVWCIDEDEDGNLWFACFGAGISHFNGQHFTSYTKKDGLVDNSVRIVKYSTIHNCLAIGTNEAISVYKDSIFYNFSAKNGALEKGVIITGILENDSCLVFYDFSGYHYCVYFDDNLPVVRINKLRHTFLLCTSSVFQSKDGNRYFGWGRDGIIKDSKSSSTRIPNIGQVFGIAEDCLGDIWTASWNGGGISPPGGLFVLKNNNPVRLNRAYNINTILGWATFFEKKQNLIFYGTLDKGLYKIPQQYFEYYPPVHFGENQLSVNDIELDADNNILFITDSLFINWDFKSFTKKNLDLFFKLRLKHEYNSASTNNQKSRIDSITKLYYDRNSHFKDIETDRKNNSWLTIDNLGIYNIPRKSDENPIFYTSSVLKDFVFGINDTLFLCNSWSRSLVKYINFKESNKLIGYKDSLHPIYSKKIFSNEDEIWACSRISHVFMYKEGKLRTITTEDSTINKIVNDICFDTEGYTYLGGSDGRIEILCPETREKVFEINHEEYDNSVHWLRISKNMLFAGYSDGLRVYKIRDIKEENSDYRFFTESEGYTIKIVNGSVVDKTGNIWLATNDGLVKIATKLFTECNFQPLTTIIQKVEIFNKDIDWEEMGSTNSWTNLPLETPKLNPEQNHISIYFHALNFNNSEADQYYYKLASIDKDWVGPTDKKSVEYPYLHSGKYKFLVRSKNKLSGLFTQPDEFGFVILKPWYQQIWFYIFLAALVITLFIVFYNYRLKSMKKKEESKRDIMQKISELETKALQAQMNPHFLFNSINSIQSYILDNDVDEALTYLSSFSKIIRMTLEFVDRKFVSLNDVLDYLNHYVNLENMRFDELFDYEVVIDNEIDPETTLIPPMLMQTLIENSIKHGIRHLKHKGTIKLDFEKIDNDSFKCIIEDNGVGRLRSAEINKDQKIKKESLGLKIIKERLDILNNSDIGHYNIRIIDLYSDNGEPSGTRVEVTLAFIFA